MRRWAAAHPLTMFFGLAFAFTWALLPLARLSVAVSLAALQGPALAALVTARLGGRDHVEDLRRRLVLWRVPIAAYVAALVLPWPITLFRSALEIATGAAAPLQIQPVSALSIVVFVLVAGEEVGWRGFALPRLLGRMGPWAASAVLGLLWAAWHLPLFFMPGMPQYGTPFLSYVPYLMALSLLLTAFAASTGGSVIIATLFHGAVNTFGVVAASATPAQRGWGNAVSYGLAAVIVGAGLVQTRRLNRMPSENVHEWRGR